MKFRLLFKYYHLFLILLFLLHSSSSTKIISITLRKESGTYSIGSSIKYSDSLTKHFIGAINLQSQFSFFSHQELNYKNKSGQYNKVIVQIENKKVECKKLTLPHTLSYLSNINLTFYNMIDDNKYQIPSNYFSFAYQYIHEEFSIIESLKANGEIESRKIVFDPFLSFFHLGGMPEGRVENKNLFTCKINKKYFSWGCNLNSITFGDLSSSFWCYNTRNAYFYLQASERYIYVPNQFYSYLMTQFFRGFLYKKECITKKDKRFDILLCTKQVIQTFPKITFFIDKKEISIPMQNLFEFNYDESNFLELLIRVNDCDELWKREFFVFGTIFMDNFIIELNKDDDKITFYSDNSFSNSNLFEPKPLINIPYQNYLYIFLILILFINTVVLSMIKIINCNNKNIFLLSN